MAEHERDPTEKETDADAFGADIENSEEVREADRVRRKDERETARELDGLAVGQRDAAAMLRESRELLDATAARIEETQRQLHEHRDRADPAEAGRARQGDGTDAR